jgi:predicted outer membrane repeat protein
MIRPFRILSASAVLWLAAAPAAAGSLDFWEDTRGARDVTASFPTGPAQNAHIVFDANSAETGGVLYFPTEIDIRPTGSVAFVAFDCEQQGCNESDYEFTPGNAAQGGKLVVSFLDGYQLHGLFAVGTITFDGPQEPGSMPLVGCNYADLNGQERTCSPFVLLQLPEPAGTAALVACGALLFGPLRRRRTC